MRRGASLNCSTRICHPRLVHTPRLPQLDEFDPATYNPCDPPLIYAEKNGLMIYMDMSFTELNSASREQKIHTHSKYLNWEDVRLPPVAQRRCPSTRANATWQRS